MGDHQRIPTAVCFCPIFFFWKNSPFIHSFVGLLTRMWATRLSILHFLTSRQFRCLEHNVCSSHVTLQPRNYAFCLASLIFGRSLYWELVTLCSHLIFYTLRPQDFTVTFQSFADSVHTILPNRLCLLSVSQVFGLSTTQTPYWHPQLSRPCGQVISIMDGCCRGRGTYKAARQRTFHHT